MSWVGRGVGWLLTVRTCAHAKLCAGLDKTTDGAAHWRHQPLPRALVTRRSFVNGVAFNTHGVGYLFGTSLWVTRDDAKTWRRIPGPKTASLVIDGKATYRIAFHHADCPTVCEPFIQTARTGSGSWHAVHGPVDFGYGSALSASQSTIFVTFYDNPAGGSPDAQSTYLESADAGASWVQRRDACGGQDRSERDTGVVEVDRHRIAVTCGRRYPPSGSTLLQSGDNGRDFGTRQPTPFPPAAIARAGRTLLIGSGPLTVHGRYEYVVASSRDNGRDWHEVLLHGAPASDVDNGRAILQCAQAKCAYLVDPRHVLVSLDSGRTWTTRGI
jgi:hypothetical protein